MPLESQTYAETAFQGMDARTAPDRLAPGVMSELQNGFPDGQGGIIGRGAFVGQLTTPLTGGPIWAAISVVVGPVTSIVFAQGGKLWRHQVGGSTCTEILVSTTSGTASFSFPSGGEHVHLVRHGEYVYISGASGGVLHRFWVNSVGAWVAQRWGGRVPAPTLEWEGTTTHVSSGTGQLATVQSWVVTTTNEPIFLGWPLASGILSAPSNPIPAFELSAPLITDTLDTATLKVSMPFGIAGVTNFLFWRQDSTFPDGRYRLVDVQGLSSVVGGNWTWNSGTQEGVWRDEFPAENLLNRPTLEVGELLSGSEPISSLTTHSGRLWAVQGNTVNASWLLDYEPLATDSGLVWTAVPDENDPAYEAKGASFTLGGAKDNDTIVALSQAQADTAAGDYGGVLIAFRQNSHTFISGDSPASWRAEPSRAGEHFGCLSPRGIANVDGTWLYHSPRGVQTLVTNGPPRYLGEIDGQFPLESRLSQDALRLPLSYRRLRYLYYDRQLWVFAPALGDTDGDLSVIWVWNARTNGWSWLSPPESFTGGLVLSDQNDTGQFYLTGMDGQLYRYDRTAALDKPTPAHTGNAYTLSVSTQEHGQQSGSGAWSAFSKARPLSLSLDIEHGAGSAPILQWWVLPGEAPAITVASGTQALASGRNTITVPTLPDVRGITHKVRLDIAGAGPTTRLAGYSLTCVEQGMLRQL